MGLHIKKPDEISLLRSRLFREFNITWQSLNSET